MLKQVNEIFGCFRWKHVLLTTKFSRTHPGKLQYLHFLVFNNHTKSLYVVQFWQLAWKLSILLPPFLSNSWHWQNGVAEEGGGVLFSPLTFSVLFLIKNRTVYLYLSWNTQTHSMMYCILKICWFICKDCARLNRKILLRKPSYQSRAYLAWLNSVVPFSVCARGGFEKPIMFLFHHRV